MEKQSPIPNAEKLGFQPLKIRYVVYSPSYGLFLGNDKEGRDQWSKSDPEFSDRAPTFEAGMRLGDVVKTLVPGSIPTDTEFREAWPDLPNDYCSQNAVANAMLPRWI
jgi:hypothetical protein